MIQVVNFNKLSIFLILAQLIMVTHLFYNGQLYYKMLQEQCSNIVLSYSILRNYFDILIVVI